MTYICRGEDVQLPVAVTVVEVWQDGVSRGDNFFTILPGSKSLSQNHLLTENMNDKDDDTGDEREGGRDR